MLRISIVALAAVFWASASFFPAWAADTPANGPAPAWVLPAPLPASAAQTADPSGVRVILQDTQFNFTAKGYETYVHTVVRLDSPQSLATAGTIAIPWRPSSEALTVHAINVRRGQQVINALKNQKFVVLRRENNLEAATLDGVLTATLQLEGLQIGDTVEMELTVARADPLLKGFSDAAGMWTPGPYADRMRLRARWPAEEKLNWKLGAAFSDPPKITNAGGETEFLVDVASPKAWSPPSGAPLRYQLGGLYEFSEFRTWTEVSRLFSPLYAAARSIGERSPLKGEAAKIRAASSDQKVQALAALALVQNSVRYVALVMGEGNLMPAKADETWQRRFGDCKGKTALLLGLLDQLGIAAEPAVVSVQAGDGLNERLPRSSAFDHVIVHATIAGVSYWLDGADIGDVDLASLRASPYDWALPLRPEGAELVKLPNPALDQPIEDARLQIDLSAGLDKPAPTHAEVVLRGAAAKVMKITFANLDPSDRERVIRSYWNEAYPFLKATTVQERFDVAKSEQHIIADGVAALDWQNVGTTTAKRYEVNGSILGWAVNLKRLDGEDAKAPYAVRHPTYSVGVVTITLPKVASEFVIEGANVSTTLGGMTFTRQSKIEAGVFTMQSIRRSVAPEFPASEADIVDKRMRELSRDAVFLRSPVGNGAGKGDLLADVLSKARAQATAGNIDQSIAELDKALALDPKVVPAIIMRGALYEYRGDHDKAKKDLERARALDQNVQGVNGLEARIAMGERRFSDAIDAMTREITAHPDAKSYGERASAYYAMAQKEKALADTAEALRLDPALFGARQLRVSILRSVGQTDRALAELNEAIFTRPNDADLYLLKGAMHIALGQKGEALVAFDKAVSVRPSVQAYMNRLRARDDAAAKLEDIESALALEPENKEALAARADVYVSQGKYADALADFNKIIGSDSKSDYFVGRARVYVKAGQKDLAAKDFAAERASAAGKANAMNNLCWSQATLGVFLEAALADCDEALRLAPGEPAYMDSRALVLLRIGRLDEAISVYDAALSGNRGEFSSALYGRGIAKLRKGLKDDGAKDLAAARKQYIDVDKQFTDYGVTPPSTP